MPNLKFSFIISQANFYCIGEIYSVNIKAYCSNSAKTMHNYTEIVR